MRALLDTSVVVAGLVEAHPHHARAFVWLEQAYRKSIEALLAAHCLAEVQSVLTVLPVNPHITPATAWTLVEKSILPCFEIVSLEPGDVRRALEHAAAAGAAGGAVWDALLLEAAVRGRADIVLSWNVRELSRLASPGGIEIREP
jgi:predicted nucleic acid-binding protein